MEFITWSFELNTGRLIDMPLNLTKIANWQNSKNATSFIYGEAGLNLNEPDEQFLAAIMPTPENHEVIARFADAFTWLFDCWERESCDDCGANYLKITFVNLTPLPYHSGSPTQTKTNAANLVQPDNRSVHLFVPDLLRFLRSFSFYIGSAVEYQEFDQELFGCDWVSLLAYKVGRAKQRA